MRIPVILVTLAALSLLQTGAMAAASQPSVVDDDMPPGQQWLALHRKENTSEYKQVAASVGTVLMVEDDNSPAFALEVIFDEEYRKIRKLPLQYRKKFFWTLMFRLRLRNHAHFTEEFLEALAADCGEVLIKDLDSHILEEKKLGVAEENLEYARWLHRMLGLLVAQKK